MDALIAEREARGPYRSLAELCRRTDLTRINRRTLEALIRSGSMDTIGPNRASLLAGLPAAMQLGDQTARAHEAGQNDMFGLATLPAPSSGAAGDGIPVIADFSEAVRLQGERETLGLYLTGHPINRFEADLPRFAAVRIGELISERPVSCGEGERGFSRGRLVTVAGLVDEIRKRGQRVSIILDDRTGRIEVTLFEEIFQRHRDLIVKDAIVLVEGHFRFDEFGDAWRIAARKITDLNAVREAQARRLVLKLPQRPDRNALLTRLAEGSDPLAQRPLPGHGAVPHGAGQRRPGPGPGMERTPRARTAGTPGGAGRPGRHAGPGRAPGPPGRAMTCAAGVAPVTSAGYDPRRND